MERYWNTEQTNIEFWNWISNLKKRKKNKNKTKQKKPTNHKNSGPGGFTAKFYQMYVEEFLQILLKLFQKIKKGGLPHKSFNKASITLISMPDNDTTITNKTTGQYLWLIEMQKSSTNY